MRIFYSIVLTIVIIISTSTCFSQAFTNKGRDFWVGYQRTNGFSQGNTQTMKIYMGAEAMGDTVRIAIGEGTSKQWIRYYYVAPFTTVVSDDIPKDTSLGFPLVAQGMYPKYGIHITSHNADIVAYAHIYEAANSGATMLMPVTVLGCENYVLSSRQYYSTTSYSAFHVVATHDSTWVEINPSKPTLGGWTHNGGTQPNGSYLVKLNKGDVYQVLGAILSGSEGQDLTGSSVISVSNAQGVCHPIAVFCGSTRTGIGCSGGTGSSGDLILQQVFPYQSWGTMYASAPTSNDVGPTATSNMRNIFRIMVKDPTTVVRRNGVVLTSLVGGKYYQYESDSADYITSDKPVLVAQFMSSNGNCANTGSDGDPEMFYISPMDQAIKTAQFYRNDQDAIDETFMTIIVPGTGLPTLQIDGQNYASQGSSVYAYPHPHMPGYYVVTKKWGNTAGPGRVTCSAAFTGIIYGEGPVESYGYNIGAQFDSLNLQAIRFNSIHGYIFQDKNSNGTKDINEPLFTKATVVTMKPGIDTLGTMTGNGYFDIYTDTGTYISTATPYVPYYNAVPASHTSSFYNYYNNDTVVFAMQPIPGKRDLAVNLISTGGLRQGRPLDYTIKYSNMGTDTTNANIELVISNKLNYVSASLVPNYMNGDTLRWNVSNLQPGVTGSIAVNLTVKTSPSANIGDTVHSIVSISSVGAELTPTDNIAIVDQRITGSYDPNGKKEDHLGRISLSDATSGKYLVYTIQFQNTGTDTAFRVVIKDTLDNKLDWSSLRIVGASHNFQLTITGDKRLAWNFNSIYLPDSNHNEPASHGYVTYIVRARNTVQVGDLINNRASIYFDNNPPIVTNNETTLVVSDISPLKLMSFTASKKGTTNLLEWTTTDEVNVNNFEVERSSNGRSYVKIGTAGAENNGQPTSKHYSFVDEKPLPVSYYRLKIVDKDGSYSYSPIRKISTDDGWYLSVYPNPVKDNLQLIVEGLKKGDLQTEIVSQDGRVVQTMHWSTEGGRLQKTLNTSRLPRGIYLLRLTSGDGTQQAVRFEKR